MKASAFICFAIYLCFGSHSQHLVAKGGSVAMVQGVQGEAMILRKPQSSRPADLGQGIEQQGFQLVSYNQLYWQAYPILGPVPLAYGDIVLTGTSARAYVVVGGRHHLVLADNSAAQILPDFIDLFHSRKPRAEIKVHAGRVRMQAGDGQISLRSPTMVVSLNRAECLFAVHAKSSQVLVLQGKIDVIDTDPNEKRLYSESLHDYQAQNFHQLSNRSAMRHRMGSSQTQSMTAGKLRESWEEMTRQDLHRLRQILGPVSAKALLNQGPGEVRAAREADLRYYEPILPDMPRFLESIDFYQLKEPAHDLFLAYTDLPIISMPSLSPGETIKTAPQDRWLAIRLGYADIASSFGTSFGVDAKLAALELELRPWKYTYGYLALATGQANAENMTNYLGLGAPEAMNSYSHITAGLGFRIFLGSRLALSLGGSLLHMQQLNIQYEDVPSNVNRTYTISMLPTALAELGLSLKTWGQFEFFLRYAQGKSQARLDAKDIANRYQSQSDVAYGIIGLGWSTY